MDWWNQGAKGRRKAARSRKFLGFTLTLERKSRVNIAPQAVQRFKDKLRSKFREGRGRNLRAFLDGLKPLLRGWANLL
jgi:RNA-directed DNA polymerase